MTEVFLLSHSLPIHPSIHPSYQTTKTFTNLLFQTYLGHKLRLRCLPRPLPRQHRLPRRHTPRLRLCRRSLHFPRPNGIARRHYDDTSLRNSNHPTYRRVPANGFVDWSFVCDGNMAFVSVPGALFWLGDGVFVRGWGGDCAAVV